MELINNSRLGVKSPGSENHLCSFSSVVGESGSSRDAVPRVPEPGRTAQLSGATRGAPLRDSVSLERSHGHRLSAEVGTEEAASQSAPAAFAFSGVG